MDKLQFLVLVNSNNKSNQQKIEVIELERYCRRTCSKLRARWVYNMDRRATAQRPSYVCSTSSTVDEFCWYADDRLAVAIFSKSRVWNKIPEGTTLIFVGTLFSCNTLQDRWKQAQSVQSFHKFQSNAPHCPDWTALALLAWTHLHSSPNRLYNRL